MEDYRSSESNILLARPMERRFPDQLSILSADGENLIFVSAVKNPTRPSSTADTTV
jgi:hypothetical protein